MTMDVAVTGQIILVVSCLSVRNRHHQHIDLEWVRWMEIKLIKNLVQFSINRSAI